MHADVQILPAAPLEGLPQLAYRLVWEHLESARALARLVRGRHFSAADTWDHEPLLIPRLPHSGRD